MVGKSDFNEDPILELTSSNGLSILMNQIVKCVKELIIQNITNPAIYAGLSLFLALQYTEVCYKSEQKIVEIITFKVYYIHKLKT